MLKSKSPLKTFLLQRKNELRARVGEEYWPVIEVGFHLMEDRLAEAHGEEVTPQMIRRLDLLETLLFSFVSHAADFELLAQMEETMQSLREVEPDADEGDGGMVH